MITYEIAVKHIDKAITILRDLLDLESGKDFNKIDIYKIQLSDSVSIEKIEQFDSITDSLNLAVLKEEISKKNSFETTQNMVKEIRSKIWKGIREI